jgi:hypothetical protein
MGAPAKSTPRPDAAAHREAISAAFPVVVAKLVAILGKKLTAYIGGARDTRTVERWMNDIEPYRNPDDRIRLAFQVAQMLVEKDDPRVVQAWFTGLNPDLNDRAPIRFFRDEDFETAGPRVIAAARSFLVGG